MALQNSDNLIIGRGDTPYKITYQTLKEDLNIQPGPDPGDPIVVSKGVITPSTDVKVGDTLTGSATVTDAVNPVVVHVWELDGVEDQRGSSATYTAKEGAVKYRQEVTDDNHQTATIGDWSDAVTVTSDPIPPDPEPTATMSGLRFDQGRLTYLHNAGSATGNWTFSCWVKSVGQSSAVGYLLADEGNTGINLKTDSNVLRWHDGSAYTLAPAIPENKWVNIVVTAEDKVLKAYVNGEYQGYSPTVSNSSFTSMSVGKYTDNVLDGYMSDAYFVDGKVVPPTVFGKLFDGNKWGPLEYTTVKDNLNASQPSDPTPPPGPGAAGQPYDTRANTDQVWSSQVVPTDAETAKAFNGDITQGTANTAFVWTTNITGVQTLEIFTQANGLNASTYSTLEVNGEDKTADLTSGNGWNTISNPPSTLTSINTNFESSAKKIDVFGIKVNGRLLVDNGVWDNSQNWSDNVSTPNGFLPDSAPTKAFDGNTDTYCDTKNTGETLNVTFPGGLAYSSKVEVFVRQKNVNAGINGGSQVEVNGDSTSFAFAEVVTGSGTMNSLEVTGTSNYVALAAVRVDGALLVDSGAQWDTSQRWSDNLTGAISATPSSNAFDGNVNLSAESVVSGVLTYTGSINGNVKLYRVNGAQSETAITANFGNGEVPFPRDRWVDFGTVNVSSFTITDNFSSSAALSAVMVDGKILVDGTAVWDTSQVWSDLTTTPAAFQSGNKVSNIFDGNASTIGQIEASSVSTEDQNAFTVDLSSIGSFTTIEVNAKNGDQTQVWINGNTADKKTLTPSLEGFQSVDFAAGSITSLTIQRANTGAGLACGGIKIDGEVLVDSAPTWDTSQTWSDGSYGTFDPSRPASKAFDGTDDWCRTGVAKMGGVSFPTISGVTSLRIAAAKDTGNGSIEVETTSGTFVDISSDYDDGTSDIETKSISGITSISGFRLNSNTANAQPRISKIFVDTGDGEKLLVDKGFGPSGFYLPFDPAQPGAHYPDATNTIGTPELQTPGSNLFNGDLEDVTGSVYSANTSGAGINWMPDSDVTGKISLFLRNGDIDNTTISWTNGGDWTDIDMSNRSAAASGSWYDIGTITIAAGTGISLKHVTTAGSNNVDWRGIAVNDAMLVNHSSIGADLSGNNNNFVDENFGVGNSNTYWSQFTSTTQGGWGTAYPLNNMYNGVQSLENRAQTAQGGQGIRLDLPSEGMTVSSSISIWSDKSSVAYSINDGQQVVYDDAVEDWKDIPFSGQLTSLQLNHGTNNSGTISCSGLKIDGVLLVDPPYDDTVLDTPMKNYPVLDEDMQFVARNGNLTAYHNGGGGGRRTSIPLPTTGKYYFEAYTTKNEGQGAGVINGTTMGNPGAGPQTGVYGIFSAAVGAYYRFNDDTSTNQNAVAKEDDILGIAVNMDTKHITIWKNGNNMDDFTMSNTDDTKGYYFMVMGGNDPSAVIKANFGQQSFVNGIPSGYQSLFQLWKDHIRSTLGYALDRIDRLEELRLEDARTIDVLRTDVISALSRIASIESDEVNDDAVDNALLTLVGSLASQVTLWQTRIETAESALAAALERITTLESN